MAVQSNQFVAIIGRNSHNLIYNQATTKSSHTTMIWILEKFLKFIKGITFEPAFFLFMLAHGFYVIVAQTLYIGTFTYQEILFLWKS